MEIPFLGGADEVGESSVLTEFVVCRLLIHAGIRARRKARWRLAKLSLIDEKYGVDAMLLIDAHTGIGL